MTASPNRVFLDYYAERKIIPTRQDLRDLGQHFRRRRALYLHLGIVPRLLAGKDVIEFGPGSGDNAVYTASLAPRSYMLVDANPASVEAVEKKAAAGAYGSVPTEIVLSDILHFDTDRRFDLVIAEAVIPGQDNPEDYLDRVARLVADGGILVITNNSCSSMFPEVCRRLIKPIFAGRSTDFGRQIKMLTDFFRPDLASLDGMSRLPEDWVLDVILHPWKAVRFTIPDAVAALDHSFDFLAASPRFVSDWRWYKTIQETDNGFNALAVEQYRRFSPVLMDCRYTGDIPNGIDSEALEDACQSAFDLHIGIWNADAIERIPVFLDAVRDIATKLGAAMPTTAQSLTDYVSGMEEMLAGKTAPDFGSFTTLFGRGQQYASFIRR